MNQSNGRKMSNGKKRRKPYVPPRLEAQGHMARVTKKTFGKGGTQQDGGGGDKDRA